MRYNPPPNWPQPPPGWTPYQGWRPDPAWGPPPPGWKLWVEDSGYGLAPTWQYAAPGAPRHRATSPVAWLMMLVPLVTLGTGAFVPALWAASHATEAGRRRRLLLLGLVLGALAVLSWTLVAVAPTGPDGIITGWQGNGGPLLMIALMVTGVGTAIINRRPDRGSTPEHAELPGVSRALERRRQREEYRALAARDPWVAQSIGVGRPDITRDFDDGGLLDLNSLSAAELSRYGGLPASDADQVVAVRERLGRLQSVSELEAYGELSPSGLATVKEVGFYG